MTEIDQNAFENCSKLTKIVFAANSLATNITRDSFKGLGENAEYTVTGDNGDLVKVLHNAGISDKQISLVDGQTFDLQGGLITTVAISTPNLNIPATYQNIQITGIKPGAFTRSQNLTKISFDPDSVITKFDTQTFSGCTKLQEITIPKSVTEIDQNAFSDCSNLHKIIFAAGAMTTHITKESFAGVGSNAEYTVTGDNEALITALHKIGIDDDHITLAGGEAFDIENGLITNVHPAGQELTIPTSYQSIQISGLKPGAFKNCASLTVIKFATASMVKKLALGTFSGCAALQTVNIPKNVTEIDQDAFENCPNLTKIIFDENSQATQIHAKAFAGLKAPNFQVMGDNTKVIDVLIRLVDVSHLLVFGQQFQIKGDGTIIKVHLHTNEVAVTIPFSYDHLTVSGLAAKAFSECPRVTKITFAKNSQATKIDHSAFANLTHAEYIVDGDNTAVINALQNANVTDAQISVINGEKFDLRGGLITKVKPEASQSLSLPKMYDNITISGIGANAFSDFTAVKQITFAKGSQLIHIAEDAFKNLGDDVIYTLDYADTDVTMALKTSVHNYDRIILTGNGDFDVSLSGLVYKAHVLTPSITIPTKWDNMTLTGVAPHAFSECHGVSKITFAKGSQITKFAAESFTGIQPDAFYYIQSSDRQVANALQQKVMNHDHIILTGSDFDISISGLINKVRTASRSVFIPRQCLDVTVSGLMAAVFSECHNLNRIIFANGSQATRIASEAFSQGVSSDAYYFVYNDEPLIKSLTTAGIDGSHIGVAHGDFFTASTTLGRILGLTELGVKQTTLQIGTTVTSLWNETFVGCHPNLGQVNFAQGAKFEIDGGKLVGLPQTTQYFFDRSDLVMAQSFGSHVGDKNNVIVTGAVFNMTITGNLAHVNSSGQTNMQIPRIIDGVELNGLDPHAFDGGDSLVSVEFAAGIQLTQGIKSGALSGLGPTTLLYVYSDDLAKTLSGSQEVGLRPVGLAKNHFFLKYNENSFLVGLTSLGRKVHELSIPATVEKIGANAFDCCSPSLAKITIHGKGVSFENGVFNTPAMKAILPNIQFYVYDASVRDALIDKHQIPSDHVHLNASGPAMSTAGLSVASIGIIVGSICLAIIIFGLGIGIPMRRQHKVNVLNAKLTNRRVAKLSTANAAAFKKVVEAAGVINRQVGNLATGMRALKAAKTSPVKKIMVKKPLTSKPKIQPPARPTRSVPRVPPINER